MRKHIHWLSSSVNTNNFSFETLVTHVTRVDWSHSTLSGCLLSSPKAQYVSKKHFRPLLIPHLRLGNVIQDPMPNLEEGLQKRLKSCFQPLTPSPCVNGVAHNDVCHYTNFLHYNKSYYGRVKYGHIWYERITYQFRTLLSRDYLEALLH